MLIILSVVNCHSLELSFVDDILILIFGPKDRLDSIRGYGTPLVRSSDTPVLTVSTKLRRDGGSTMSQDVEVP